MAIDWTAIARAHGPVVWKTAYRILGRDADASDCFQETFMSALKVTKRGTVRDWPRLLQRLATTRALDLLRKRIRQRRRQEPVADYEQFPSAEEDPLRKVQAAELGEQLMTALVELPPQQSETFCLRYLNGLSYAQIAEEMGITIDGVGVALSRARGSLRDLLGCVVTDEPEWR